VKCSAGVFAQLLLFSPGAGKLSNVGRDGYLSTEPLRLENTSNIIKPNRQTPALPTAPLLLLPATRPREFQPVWSLRAVQDLG